MRRFFGSLDELNRKIIDCRLCPRLTRYREYVARVKVKRYRDWSYWGRPLPGYGDPDARLLVIGLAPAAHGGNRTGRMFTGDSSGDWLVKALYENGFANQGYSISRDDGLMLHDCYVTAVVRCAPPGNRPNRDELNNCNFYLINEFMLLKNVRVVVTLGRVSLEWSLRALSKLYNTRLRLEFRHGALYRLPVGGLKLITSYHPSRQNTQTGRLKWGEWLNIFKMARLEIGAC